MSDLASQIAGLSADKLQALLERLREKKGRALPLGIPAAERTMGWLPVSYAQRRLWFLNQLEPEDPSYNLATALELEGELAVPAIASSLAELVRRHEVLRTSFAVWEGEPVQVVAAASGWTLPLVDLAALTADASRTAAERLAAEAAARPFDLANGPLFRTSLLRLEPGRHLLVLALHHIVFDAWSMGVLLEELSKLYAALSQGRRSPLPELAIQYGDFAVWQRQQLAGEARDAQLAYWRQRLAGQAPLDLPADRPRGAPGGPRGGWCSEHLPARLAAALKRLADSEGATLFMVLFAGFLALLQRYTGRDDLSVGVPTAGRQRGEVEDLIGCFVNPLVFRTDLAGAASFRELVRRVRTTALAAYAHQDLPFECLVEALQPVRSSENTPLFQVVFQLKSARNLRGDPLRLGPLALTVRPVAMHRAQFDLSLEADEDAAGLLFVAEYDRSRFESVRLRRLLRHLGKLLDEAAAAPGRRPEELPILTAAEQQVLLCEWNSRESVAIAGTLHGRFEGWAARTPDAIAVVCAGESVTYGELAGRAAHLAGRLRAAGAGPESRVAICLERSAHAIVAILAVLKAGAAYVPIDPRLPAERIDFLLGDSGARILVSELRRGGALRRSGVTVLGVDGEAEGADGPAVPSAWLPPDGAAYVIYTSGSTGQPKGVVVSHANVLRLFAATERWLEFSPADVWACFHSFAFDFSVWEICGALLYGGRLVIVPYWVSRSPDAFYDLLVTERVSVLSQTPSAFLQLSQEDERRAGGISPALRTVVFGGEALDPAALLPWLARHGAVRPRLINMYGITEITVHATYGRVDAASSCDLGRPLPDLAVYLLDPWQQPVPVGVPGEIHVGGPGVARGYLDQPALTAERFLPDPWAGQPGGRLYRSGDRARYLPNGAIEYLGRLDEQVKIRGFRIEPAEVETALRRHPAVADAAVVARRIEGGQHDLIAYVVAQGEWDGTGISKFLRQRLPEHMVPAHVIPLPSLPLTINGKLDRAGLPQPADSRPAVRAGAPRTPLEEAFARIWGELLGVSEIGLDNTFFDLGGDSLKAVRLVNRLNAELGADLRVKDVFRFQTIAALIGNLPAATGAGGELAAGMLELAAFRARILADPAQTAHLPPDWEDVYPLGAIEKGMIYYSLLLPDEPVYLDQYVYFLALPQPRRLAVAFARLLDKHSLLRTSFHLFGFAEPVHVVNRTVIPLLWIVDLTGLAEAEQWQEIAAYRRQDLDRRLRFDGDLLWRLALFVLRPGLQCAVWTFHHALLDGWSNLSLWRELNDLCLGPEPVPPLPELRSSHRDYLALTLGRRVSRLTEGYWREHLRGASRGRLPFNARRRSDGPGGMQVARRTPPPPLLAGLRRQAAVHHLPLKALLLAAHMALLRLLTAEEDLVTGVVSNDRPEIEDGDKVLGCFLNTLPLRLRLPADVRGAELAATVSRYLQEVKAHEIYLADIARLTGAAGGGENPIFDTLFNWVDFHILEGASPTGILAHAATYGRLGDLAGSAEMTNTRFDLEVSTTFDRLSLRIKYSPGFFTAAEIETALDFYLRILERLGQDLAAELSGEALLTQAEKHQAVVGFNATEKLFARNQTLHGLFEERARAAPDSPAVIDGEGYLSYGQLNGAANRLARHLRALGVAGDDRVALVVERGAVLIIGLLAILKAGAAYVPIEPDHPPARKGEILTGAGVRYVLVDRPYDLGAAAGSAQSVAISSGAAGYDAGDLGLATDPAELAYIIYTSGSTGTPKGVMIEHRSAVNLVSWVNRVFEVGAGDTLLLVTSAAFDLSVYDVFGMLAAGGRVVIAGLPQVRDPEALWHLLTDHQVSFWDSVPSTMEHLVAWLEQQPPDRISQVLRLVFLSGDWIPVGLPARVKARFPNARIVSLGGATEATVWSNFHPVAEAADAERRSIPYGRPIDNTSFLVLDPAARLVASGAPGELYIGGVGVARGYAGDPCRTALSFVPDPFGAVPGGRLYRTGDLGRMLPEGEIELLGRVDRQMKVRGYRVEPGEVENQICRHPQVREAAVVVAEDGGGSSYLCAYVVGAGEQSARELRAHLQATLPAYMIPSEFIQLPALPLTPNGKLDRGALARGELRGISFAGDRLAPRNEVEEALAEIWEQVLGRRDFGVEDNFFEIGGHSLSVLQIIGRVRDELAVDVPLAAFFDDPTVAGLAAALVEHELQPGLVTAAARLRRRIAAMAPEQVSRLLAGTGEAQG